MIILKRVGYFRLDIGRIKAGQIKTGRTKARRADCTAGVARTAEPGPGQDARSLPSPTRLDPTYAEHAPLRHCNDAA